MEDGLMNYVMIHQKLRQRFNHKIPTKQEFSPFKADPKIHWAAVQNVKVKEKSPSLNKKGYQLGPTSNRCISIS